MSNSTKIQDLVAYDDSKQPGQIIVLEYLIPPTQNSFDEGQVARLRAEIGFPIEYTTSFQVPVVSTETGEVQLDGGTVDIIKTTGIASCRAIARNGSPVAILHGYDCLLSKYFDRHLRSGLTYAPESVFGCEQSQPGSDGKIRMRSMDFDHFASMVQAGVRAVDEQESV